MNFVVQFGTKSYQLYNGLLERQPVRTKSVTSGIMYAGGDAIAQYVEHRKANEDKATADRASFVLDRKRLVVFFVYGTCVAGPVYHYWFNYLNELPQVLWRLKQSQQRGKILRAYAYLRSHNIEVKLDTSKLPVTAPLSKWKSKAAKIAADQLIFSSLYTLSFFMGIGLLSGAADRLDAWLDHAAQSATPPAARRKRATATAATASSQPSEPAAKYQELIDRLKLFLQEQEDVFYGTSTANDDGPCEEDDEQCPATAETDAAAASATSVSTSTSTSPLAAKDGMTGDQLRLLEDVLARLEHEQQLATRDLTWRRIWDQTWAHTREVYWTTYVTDCLVWPPLQLINFSFIPVRFQFLYVNVANLAWNTFLSLMANEKGGHGPPSSSSTASPSSPSLSSLSSGSVSTLTVPAAAPSVAR